MITLPTFIWIALIITLIVVRFIWKGVRRGVMIALIVVVGLWGVRVLQPDLWNMFVIWVQSGIGRLMQ